MAPRSDRLAVLNGESAAKPLKVTILNGLCRVFSSVMNHEGSLQ